VSRVSWREFPVGWREEEGQDVWEGTFADYLSLVKADPRLARSAHARMYDMIVRAGVESTPQGKRYAFFADSLFGVEAALERLVEEYLRPAARGLDARRRILLLVGPVASGKSTLVALLKRGLEEYSRTDEGALYALKDCPMHEEPLHLIPASLRPEFFRRCGIRIEGELCPYCRLMLREVYGGRIEDMPVRRIFISEPDRIGIGTFVPSDPKSQDLAELTGSLDFARITRYGSESDPRAYCFDGELNRANRGLMEFQELLKVDERFLYLLLSLAQEGNFKAGRFALISCDTVVVGHTNEADYRRFRADPRNQALCSRLFVLPFPYTLRVDAEVRIYHRLLSQGDLRAHLAPRALRAAAVFSVLSRLEAPRLPDADLLKKLRLYNREEGTAEPGSLTAEDLAAETTREGMSGVDPRLVFERLGSAVVAAEGGCLTPGAVLDSLEKGLRSYPGPSGPEKERLLDLLGLAREDYHREACREVGRVLAEEFAAEARALFQRYVNEVRAYLDHRAGGREADEEFLRRLEAYLGIEPAGRRAFREELLRWWDSFGQGQGFDYRQHPELRQAVEEILLFELGGRLQAQEEPAEAAGVRAVIRRLVEERGYCPVCAAELLHCAASAPAGEVEGGEPAGAHRAPLPPGHGPGGGGRPPSLSEAPAE